MLVLNEGYKIVIPARLINYIHHELYELNQGLSLYSGKLKVWDDKYEIAIAVVYYPSDKYLTSTKPVNISSLMDKGLINPTKLKSFYDNLAKRCRTLDNYKSGKCNIYSFTTKTNNI